MGGECTDVDPEWMRSYLGDDHAMKHMWLETGT